MTIEFAYWVDGDPCLSCFSLAKSSKDGSSCNTNVAYMSPECLNGRVTPESVIFNFGIVLRDLLSGTQISDDLAQDMIMGKQLPAFMDSRLKGEYSFEEATALKKLASQCLLNNPKDRPTIKDVNATLAQVQSNAVAPSNAMPGIQEQDKTPPMPRSQRQDKTSPIRGTQKQDKTRLMPSSPKQNTTPPMPSRSKQDTAPSMQGTQKQDRIPPMHVTQRKGKISLTPGGPMRDKTPPIRLPPSFPMAEAVARMDLTAIHQVLVLVHYKGDNASRELSLQDWTQQHKREMMEARKRGDLAFNDKDLKTAIETLCYLMSDQPDNALRDAMQAQLIQTNWPTALYLQAVALRQPNMNSDSANVLKEATALEEQRLKNTR
ncbi:putative protein kinase RLK-Pelle-RLCK-XII-1 family [Dioscorea sansibarensis]